jgi:fused signal recognition particle receptor
MTAWRTALGSVESPEAVVIAAVAMALVVAGLIAIWLRRRASRRARAVAETATQPGLRQGLAKTRSGLLWSLLPLLGRQRLDADTVEQLEAALLAADVGVKMTQRLLAAVHARRDSEASVTSALEEEIVAILSGPDASHVRPRDPRFPCVVMVVGVNGVGKTTTIGKLAARFVREGKRTMVVAADTFRAAAIEQLAVWAERSGADLVRQQHGGDPGAVAFDGMRAATSRRMDVVIVDTAGRLHTKSNLMEELRKIRRVVAREIPGAPHETLLVIDAVTGQNGLAQAKAFLDHLEVSGVILTKLDGTARGGIVLAIAGELNLPIRFVGVGESIDDLREFDAREFASALLEPMEASELA